VNRSQRILYIVSFYWLLTSTDGIISQISVNIWGRRDHCTQPQPVDPASITVSKALVAKNIARNEALQVSLLPHRLKAARFEQSGCPEEAEAYRLLHQRSTA
jgi:hypothetical protein